MIKNDNNTNGSKNMTLTNGHTYRDSVEDKLWMLAEDPSDAQGRLSNLDFVAVDTSMAIPQTRRFSIEDISANFEQVTA